MIKKLPIFIGIALGIILNSMMGVFLFNRSLEGHSTLGLLVGVATPILSIFFYSFYIKLGYPRAKQHKKLFLNTLLPGFGITGALLAINVCLLLVYGWSDDFLLFTLYTTAIFFIPNAIFGFVYYIWLKTITKNRMQ